MASFAPGIPFNGADVSGDTLRTFLAFPGSADKDLSPNRDVLEQRSRNLFNNAPFAGAALNTNIVNVVGTGLTCRPCPDGFILGITDKEAKEWSKRTAHLFELWASSKSCDSERDNNFYQMQALVLKTKALCGDCFVLRCSKEREDSFFVLCYKVIEGNRCRNPQGVSDKRNLVMGVEKSGDEAIAYHFTKYPIFDVDGDAIPETVRVNAFDDFGIRNVIHVKLSERPGQARGLPWLTPIIPMIKIQERYNMQIVIQALIDSLFTAFIKTKSGDAPSIQGNIEERERVTPIEGRMTFGNGEAVSTKPAVELGSGNLVELGENEELGKIEHESPGAPFKDFTQQVNMMMASRLGLSYEQVQKFWTGNYNGVRAALTEAKKMFDVERDNLSSDLCQDVYNAFLHECVMRGIIECKGYENKLMRMAWQKCNWIGDAPIMLDPLNETKALKMQIDEQLKTREQATMEVNSNATYEDNVKTLGEESEVRKQNNINEPGAVSRTESVSTMSEGNEDEK